MRLFKDRVRPCALSPYIFMTDPERVPDILRSSAALPKGSTLIYRHFGAENRRDMARALRQICFVRSLQFLIGQDEALAYDVGADGLHLPEKDLKRGKVLRARYPNWLLSGAVHSPASLEHVDGLDGMILSCVFKSESSSASVPLGVEKLRAVAHTSPISVFALGGICRKNVHELIGSGVAGIAGVAAFGGDQHD